MDPLRPARKHAKSLARDLSRCSVRYIIHIALKEITDHSDQEGFPLAKMVVEIICEDRFCVLSKDAYVTVGNRANPPMGSEQVCQAISRLIQNAWKNRNMKIWQCYFPEGTHGYTACPTNREFLFAIADFVELWQGCCEEVNYAGK